MSGTNGSLTDALKSGLAKHDKIHAWQLRRTRRSGWQTYLVPDQQESERRTQAEAYDVSVFVMNGEKLGRSAITLGPGDAGRLGQRLDDAVYMASLGGDTPWTLPAGGAWPKVDAYDAKLGPDQARTASQQIVSRWRAAVAANPQAKPSSMELFCGEDEVLLENSAGLSASARGTQVSMLTLLLADGVKPAERYSWDERRRVADLDVEAIVGRVAQEAHDLTHAIVPPSGQYPVLIDADEIVGLLAPIQDNASGDAVYQKSSRFEPGKPIPVEGPSPEPLTLISNAIAPYGLTTYAFDGSGVPGQRVEIVKDNVFVRPWASKQSADYLKTAATGAFANMEIPAGKTPLADLRSDGDRVLLVRSFSWLTPDGARGNFGSEIRVGYLYEKGKVTPVKGGTVSGSVFKALGTARYARDTVFRGNYLGPEAIRFENLTVAGA
jgi:predicted Zn-dependent protease